MGEGHIYDDIDLSNWTHADLVKVIVDAAVQLRRREVLRESVRDNKSEQEPAEQTTEELEQSWIDHDEAKF